MNASLNEKLGTVKWGEFKLIDVFTVKNTSNILAYNIIEGSGTVPYLCASSENNAVSTYIDYDKKYLEKGNCIFIGGKTARRRVPADRETELTNSPIAKVSRE